jgi:ABC-type transporter Mla MlaB component
MPAKFVDARANREYPIGEGATTIGRHTDNDVCLPGRAVSRFHVRIRREEETWVLEDLGSTYGTFVNGAKVEGKLALHDGDQVRLAVTRHFPDGEINLVFREGTAPGGPVARLKHAVRAVVARQKIEEGRMVFERGEGLLVVRLSGVFRKPEVDALIDSLRKELAARPLTVALDLAGVSHLNSYGLATLVELALRQREQGKTLRAFAAAGTVRKLLLMPGEENPIQLCANQEEALRGG